ncbi:hypothetical protein SIPHO041v1_p0134 [Vibrio phage 234P1]|nr:hypothetical protein SIPHO041v1_p0134 [Vibrio phage 234P1]
MLQNKMMLQPFGSKQDIGIGEVFIALKNVDGENSDYQYYIRIPGSRFNKQEFVHGHINGHFRAQNAFRLLQKILNDWGESGDAESEKFMILVSELEEYA